MDPWHSDAISAIKAVNSVAQFVPLLVLQYKFKMASKSLTLSLLLFIFLSTGIPISSIAHGFKTKKTHLHLYFHETFAGRSLTVRTVASINKTALAFGNIAAIDDELRVGPEPASKLIGRARGLVPEVSLSGIEFLATMNFVFTDGKYSGSTLSVHGRSVLASPTREWSIIGGTGRFRMARGYILGKVLTAAPGTLVFDLDLYIST